ncbi:hypothetical protein [Actinomadura sp. DC4]|uniref:hypothetical protein n=1 Tax=Actinomadura sp. DC4 TaxID=3055069 RepID=UPI0025B1D40F|nr:hypothetical protein [Actinomadura sp. DC4]MDN3359909.1 hypothetical protein [Actinomadura sp. DC4]
MPTISHKTGFAVAALAVGGSLLAPQAAGAAPVRWGTCAGSGLDPRQECATLSVPLNHRDPGGPKIALEVSRVRATGHRRGVLLLIPGVPAARA